MSGNNNHNNDDEFDISLEDLLEEGRRNAEEYVNDSNYEDDYVYGEEDDIDYDKLGYTSDDDYSDDDYSEYDNPRPEKKVKGRYSYILEDEEEDIEEEDTKPTLQERVSRFTNRTLDFLDSKRFNTYQWVLAVGALIMVIVGIVLLFQAGTNLENNASQLEEDGAQFVAQEVAPEEYSSEQESQAVIESQQEELDNYISEKSSQYEEQVSELGELPNGYVESMDEEGNLTYIPEEEAYAWTNEEVRENTDYIQDREEAEVAKDLKVEVMPSNSDIWWAVQGLTLDELKEEDIYQTKGELIYFMDRVLSLIYPYQVVDSYLDTDTMELHVTLDINRKDELPDDFEDRMRVVYENSGYNLEKPDALTFEYDEDEMTFY